MSFGSSATAVPGLPGAMRGICRGGGGNWCGSFSSSVMQIPQWGHTDGPVRGAPPCGAVGQEFCGGIPAEQLCQASTVRTGADGRAGSGGLRTSPEWRFLEPRSPLRARPRDIAFYLVEGDFQVNSCHPFLA